MSLESTVRGGRAAAERIMTDKLRITRVVGRALDDTTLALTDTTVIIYEGIGSVTGFDAYERDAIAARNKQTVMRRHIAIPVTADGVTEGDVAEVLESKLRPQIVGRKFRIAGDPAKSSDIRRRLPAEEVLP